MSTEPLHTPILFIVFNRPEPTAAALEAIRAARPTRLYVAGDGPRADRDEADLCAQTRRIATEVDWPCEVHTLFQERNLGCRFGVTAAIDWFFEQESEGIILEDDVIPVPSFFPFMTELLARYRDDDRVMMISGDYFAGRGFDDDCSYYFTRYTHIWGWATWRRAWQQSDALLADWPALRDSGFLDSVGGHDAQFTEYWTSVFDRVRSGEIDTWDYAWILAMWRARGLAAQPTMNLVTNIGFGVDATHTTDADSWQAELETGTMEFPLRHPQVIEADRRRDAWTERHLFGSHSASLANRITHRLRNLR